MRSESKSNRLALTNPAVALGPLLSLVLVPACQSPHRAWYRHQKTTAHLHTQTTTTAYVEGLGRFTLINAVEYTPPIRIAPAAKSRTDERLRRTAACETHNGTVFGIDAPSRVVNAIRLDRPSIENALACNLSRALKSAGRVRVVGFKQSCGGVRLLDKMPTEPPQPSWGGAVVSITRTTPSRDTIAGTSIRVRFSPRSGYIFPEEPTLSTSLDTPVEGNFFGRPLEVPSKKTLMLEKGEEAKYILELLRDVLAVNGAKDWYVSRQWCALRPSATVSQGPSASWSLRGWAPEPFSPFSGPLPRRGVRLTIADGSGDIPGVRDSTLLNCKECRDELPDPPGRLPTPIEALSISSFGLLKPLPLIAGLTFRRETMHGMGSRMLAQQILSGSTDSKVDLEMVRVLADNSVGSFRFLDLALRAQIRKSTTSSVTAILALPLAWPYELGQDRLVSVCRDSASSTQTLRTTLFDQGASCERISWKEGPVGLNTIRLLAALRGMDSPDHPTLVFTALGNHTNPGLDSRFYGRIQSNQTGLPHFRMPADFGNAEHSISFADFSAIGGHLTVPVGAVDVFDNDHAFTAWSTQSPLVAPGEHVVVPASDASGPAESSGTSSSFALSGTSVSAVYAASVASIVASLSSRVLSGMELARFLYATAVDLNRTGATGLPVRRISACRATQVLLCAPPDELEQLHSCLAAGGGYRYIDEGIASCEAPEIDSECAAFCRIRPAYSAHMQGESTLSDSDARQAVEDTRAVEAVAGVMSTSDSPFFLSSFDIAALGPQPPPRSCPDCSIVWAANNSAAVWMRITHELAAGVELVAPTLVIEEPNHQQTFLPLTLDENESFGGSAEVVFEDIKIPASIPRGPATKAFIDLKVKVESGGKEIEYLDRSPLIILDK